MKYKLGLEDYLNWNTKERLLFKSPSPHILYSVMMSFYKIVILNLFFEKCCGDIVLQYDLLKKKN